MTKLILRAATGFLPAAITLLAACSGSDVYRGSWKATDAQGNKSEIRFEEKKVTFKDAKGKITSTLYSQNAVSINNGVHAYGIVLKNGNKLTIYFPLANNTRRGAILLPDRQPMFLIDRDNYITPEDLNPLNNGGNGRKQ